MRKFALLAALAAASILVASCTQADIQANEDKALAILKSIKGGARVAISVAKEAVDSVCANSDTVNLIGAGAGVIIGSQSGPNSTQNQIRLDTSMQTLSDVCNRAAANPNDPAMKSLLQTAWTAYQAAKAAKAQGG